MSIFGRVGVGGKYALVLHALDLGAGLGQLHGVDVSHRATIGFLLGGLGVRRAPGESGVSSEDSVDEDSSGPGAVGGFDPSTPFGFAQDRLLLRTGFWVVLGAGNLCQCIEEGPAVVGDGEDVLLDGEVYRRWV